MSELILSNDGFYLDGKLYQEEDFYTEDFYKYSDSVASQYIFESYLVNEVFLYLIQPFLALCFFLENNSVKFVKITGGSLESKRRLIDAALHLGISIKTCSIRKNNSFIRIKSLVNHIATAPYILYYLMKIPYLKENLTWGDFSLIRDKASASKLRNFSFHKEVEDIKKVDSIYRLFTKRKRFKWVLSCLLKSIKSFNNDYKQVVSFTGKGSGLSFLERYSTRILHTYLYAEVIESLFEINQGGTYYTGLNLERFAIVEDQKANKYNVKTICIPHGLEYGYKFPYGFTTQLFYTTSQNAAKSLNELYSSNKFVFDESIALKMFKAKTLVENIRPRVVYFSEPREPQVNIAILDELLPLCEEKNIPVFIKHHPVDNLNDYAHFGDRLPIIQNLDEALTNNICFARKSTTLIESLYNGSKPAAIITNNKDRSIFMTFPSLQDENISVFYNVEDLFDWIVKEYNKDN